MIIIGVDFHPSFSKSRWLTPRPEELQERRLHHPDEAGEVLPRSGEPGKPCVWDGGERARPLVRATAGELQFELWIGDAAEIRTKRVRKQKTDRQDAQLILKLMLKDGFPKIWVPSWENRICGNCSGIGTAWCRRVRGS